MKQHENAEECLFFNKHISTNMSSDLFFGCVYACSYCIEMCFALLLYSLTRVHTCASCSTMYRHHDEKEKPSCIARNIEILYMRTN